MSFLVTIAACVLPSQRGAGRDVGHDAAEVVGATVMVVVGSPERHLLARRLVRVAWERRAEHAQVVARGKDLCPVDRVPQRVDGGARVVSRAAAHADADLVVRAPYNRDSARCCA